MVHPLIKCITSVLVHTGGKNECSECGKSFTASSGLQYLQRFTVEKGFMSRVNAGNLFLINPVSDQQKVHVGERALWVQWMSLSDFGMVNSMGGHKCSYQAANKTISRRNLRPREGVSSLSPSNGQVFGLQCQFAYFRTRESGHCNPLSLPSQLWELPRRPSPPSVPAPTPQEPCSYTALHAQWSLLSTGKKCWQLSYEWSHYRHGNAVPTTSLPQQCTGFRAAKSEGDLDDTVWYHLCAI